MGYNIRQANSSTVTSATRTTKTISLPKRVKQSDGTYEIVMVATSVPYITVLDAVKIIKLGYCCEEKGHIYPIFLKMNGSYKQIAIEKNGMYETQPEVFKNANDSESEESTSDVVITGVMVPADINFTLDYVVSTT